MARRIRTLAEFIDMLPPGNWYFASRGEEKAVFDHFSKRYAEKGVSAFKEQAWDTIYEASQIMLRVRDEESAKKRKSRRAHRTRKKIKEAINKLRGKK